MQRQEQNDVVKEFRVGSIWVAIYAKEATGSSRYIQHSIRIQRHWKNERGQWGTTNFFLPQSLPELALAANKAYEFVALREPPDRDPRSSNGGRGSAPDNDQPATDDPGKP
jgi:hypothetical protein